MYNGHYNLTNFGYHHTSWVWDITWGGISPFHTLCMISCASLSLSLSLLTPSRLSPTSWLDTSDPDNNIPICAASTTSSMVVSDTKKDKKERNKLCLTLTLDSNTPADSGNNDKINRATSEFIVEQADTQKPYWKPPSVLSSVKE